MNQYKPKIKTSITAIILALSILLPLLINQPLMVYAENDYGVGAAIQTIVNSASSSTSGSSSTVEHGVSYRRTGYLCYLLDRQGNKVPYDAYAFKSPTYDSNAISGAEWICESRRGHTVSGWEGTAPWDCTPWVQNDDDSITSKEPDIKAYFQGQKNGKSQASFFVDKLWGNTAMENFEKPKGDDTGYILVIETIMSLQYSKEGGKSTWEGFEDEDYEWYEQEARMQTWKILPKGVDSRGDYTSIKGSIVSQCQKAGIIGKDVKAIEVKLVDLRVYLTKYIKRQAMQAAEERYKAATGREFVGPPLIGTVPNLLTTKHRISMFNTYLLKVAPQSEKIAFTEAGFTDCGKSGELSVSEVLNNGVAMMIIHYWDAIASQTTCDEPKQPVPHEAPNESTGEYNIVKNYRTVDETGNMISDDGCFVKKDVAEEITIEDEEEYKVVGWKISSTTQESIPSETWEESVPLDITQEGTTPETVTLDKTLNEQCLYVLLEKGSAEQTTCDEPKIDTPHEAPPESTGEHDIVKNYRTVDETGNMISDDGCFIKKDVSNKITIEEENEYKVVGWKTSTTTQEIPSESWETSVPSVIRSEPTQTTVELTDTEKCLYVLLEKKVKSEDVNYIISQSTITRQIFLSKPDFRNSMQRIEEFNFTWEMPQHQECTGHTFMSPCKGDHTGSHNDSCDRDINGNITCSSSHKYNCGSDCVSNTTYCTDYDSQSYTVIGLQ